MMIKADNPFIQYSGRIDFSNPLKPAFAYSGVSIKTRFEGTGIDIILDDTGCTNYYNVMIDDDPVQVVQTEKGEKQYTIAKNLSDAVHTIEIFKRTEAFCGITSFIGFILEEDKRLSAPLHRLSRKIEFIGDSITCGYGNEIATFNPDMFHFTPVNENNYMAFGALTARKFNAQHMSVCYSGRGIFRNYDGSEKGTIPLVYSKIFPDAESPLWDFSRYIPDVVVINLGCNDYNSLMFKNDLTSSVFDNRLKEIFTSFLLTIRKNYGKETKIICLTGPILTDSYPPGFLSHTRHNQLMNSIVSSFNLKNDPFVYYLELETQSPPFGEDSHPSMETHQKMADKLTGFVRQITGWQ